MNSRNRIALNSIVYKEINRFMRIWVQTLVPPAITMTLYFIIFGSLIGSRVGKMGGYDYMEFIVPGLIMMSVITNSYSNVASSFFSAKFQRFIEEMLVAPIPNSIIIWGFVAGGMARGLLVGAIVTVVSFFFAHIQIQHPLVVVVTVLLTSLLFSLGGLLNAIFAKSFDDISIVPTFILTPLTYLGGVFYSISLLPGFWQGLSHINPILYMVNAFRYGFLGTADIALWQAFTVLTVMIVAMYGLALYLIKNGVGLRH
ncbi:MAG: ABC transporter permease [Pseudomonadota bacterium]|uniref:Transport permease protein n=1 Tax=Gallaecimonas pentaromativorans TaxID=584787 RepID=A0A3N1PP21_9GAMM|nr:ABC transporter permease [Gallaecimonas pentaromativorans]MED5523294.1 ABC transporter permease [Pseudomonadota bacterium]ROQ30485.1 ABC-2 type transport system permease protein [Gallaecimonas pentaromativorans]